MFKDIKFDEKGLIPCIAQDYLTGEVLMLAYMNEESLKLTIETGFATYFSRSRQKLWKKGETSGNLQEIIGIYYDCDGDTLLALVNQTGPACHTGKRSCFYRPEKPFINSNILSEDYKVIVDRRDKPKEDSYTNYLFDKGLDKILKKIGEESSEIIIAAKNGKNEDTIGEISDFIYHLMVLMVELDIEWEDIYLELMNRQGKKSPKVKKLRESM